MAFPTAVNSQITDSITQSSVSTLGSSASTALSNLYQAEAQIFATAMQNSVNAQQHGNMVGQAVATQCVNLLLSVDTASTASGNTQVTRSTVPQSILDISSVVQSLLANKAPVNKYTS